MSIPPPRMTVNQAKAYLSDARREEKIVTINLPEGLTTTYKEVRWTKGSYLAAYGILSMAPTFDVVATGSIVTLYDLSFGNYASIYENAEAKALADAGLAVARASFPPIPTIT